MPMSAGSSSAGNVGLARSSTKSTARESTWTAEPLSSPFKDQLHEMAVAAGVPMSLSRALLSLPSQRAAPQNVSDRVRAESFLMDLRPKRFILGKTQKGFAKDEVMLALDKAVNSGQPAPVVEALLQLAESAGATSGPSSVVFTTDKKGRPIPTLDHIFSQAEHSKTPDVWRTLLGRVSAKALDTSLSNALSKHTNDVARIRELLEYGANPEMCQGPVFDLMSPGHEEIIELVFLSQRIKDVEMLNQGLVQAVRAGSLRNTSLLLWRGAEASFNHAEALKLSVTMRKYELALALLSLSKTQVSSSNLDDATSLIATPTGENQKMFLKLLLLAGASGPRISKAILPMITSYDEMVIPFLTESLAFRHSTFPAPQLFQMAVQRVDLKLASSTLQASSNRSFSDYASTGAHLHLVRNFSCNAEQWQEIISELLTLGAAGDYSSQMLAECCRPEHLEAPLILSLIQLLIANAGAKTNYREGLALLTAVKHSCTSIVAALMLGKPSKKLLNLAVTHANSSLSDHNPAKSEILCTLIEAGASGPAVDDELVAAIDKSPFALTKVKILLQSASLNHGEGKAVAKAIELERVDILEMMFSQSVPQRMALTSIWKQVRKMFAIAESTDKQLPYNLAYVSRIYDILYGAGKDAAPVHDLLLDATRCDCKDTAFNLTTLFLRWGASPNHARGAPLQACIKRADTQTLAALLSTETSKTSLKYGFTEALLLPGNVRFAMLEMLIAAGLEQASLDASLPQVLKYVAIRS